MLFSSSTSHLKVGDVVRTKTSPHDLEVVYLNNNLFKPNTVNVLGWTTSGEADVLRGLSPDSLDKVSK